MVRFVIAGLAWSACLLAASRAEIPRSALALVHQSRVEVGRGELENARLLARQAVELDPAYADAWKQLGRACMLAHRPIEALRALDTARALEPADAEIARWRGPLFRDLGWWHWARGNPDDAVAAFNEALRAQVSNSNEVIRAFYTVLAESGRPEDAARFLQAWADRDAMLALALAHLDQGRLRAAEPALALLGTTGGNPDQTAPLLAHTRAMMGNCETIESLLAPVLQRTNILDERTADMALEALLLCNAGPSTSRFARLEGGAERRRDPALTDRMDQAARAALAQREFALAFRLYDRVLARDPARRSYLRAAAAAEGLRGRNGAMQFLSERLASSPGENAADGMRGRLAQLAGQTEAAARHYAQSLAGDPDQPDVRREYILALVALGRPDEAREQLRWFAEREERGDTSARIVLAETLNALSDHAAALEFWSALATRHPNSAYYTVERARTLMRLGRSEEAVDLLTPLADRTRDVQAHELLAQALIERGDNPDALHVIEKALEIEYSLPLLRLRERAGGMEAERESEL